MGPTPCCASRRGPAFERTRRAGAAPERCSVSHQQPSTNGQAHGGRSVRSAYPEGPSAAACPECIETEAQVAGGPGPVQEPDLGWQGLGSVTMFCCISNYLRIGTRPNVTGVVATRAGSRPPRSTAEVSQWERRRARFDRVSAPWSTPGVSLISGSGDSEATTGEWLGASAFATRHGRESRDFSRSARTRA